MNKIYSYQEPFLLESRNSLSSIEIAYTTYGNYLPSKKKKVIWVCHALTANSDVFAWWPGLFGLNQLFNSEEYYIVCANVIGSCYGTTGPLSNLQTEVDFTPLYHDFPEITIRDMVKAHILLANHLEIPSIDYLIGGSLGGQQALEWAIMEPDRIKKLCLIATNSRHSAWGIAFNESQRMAIATDITWKRRDPLAGLEGLKTARSIALLTYRNYRTYQEKQKNEENEIVKVYRASSYQRYQGEKLAKRFNAFSYWALTRAMDSHNIARGRGSLESTLAQIHCSTLVISFTSDILFPTEEQEFLAKHLLNARLAMLDSLYGHDGFLMETTTLSKIIKEHLIED